MNTAKPIINTSKELAGKTAIVTGGGSGIGRAISILLASLGINISIADINAEDAESVANEINMSGGRAIAIKTDVSDAEDVESMVSKTIDQYGKIDILINNAGVCRNKRLLDTTSNDLDLVMKSIVYGTILCTREVWKDMKKQQSGHIIQICSRASEWAPAKGIIYGTAKTAQLKFTLHLESEFELAEEELKEKGMGPGNFHTHVLCPSSVDTPLNATIGISLPKENMLSASDVADVVLELIRHPESGVQDLAQTLTQGDYKITANKLFSQYPNVVNIMKRVLLD